MHLGTLLLDLSSSVDNVLLQAALQSGCFSSDVEVMKKPVEMACEQHVQVMMCAQMCGARVGDVEFGHAIVCVWVGTPVEFGMITSECL